METENNKIPKETWEMIIKIAIAVLTGIASALGMASCMHAAGMTGFLIRPMFKFCFSAAKVHLYFELPMQVSKFVGVL